MKDKLLTETLDKYNKVISVYKATGYGDSYKLNAFWSDANMKEMLKIFSESQNAKDAIHAVQRTWLFSVNSPDSVKEKAVDWLLADQKNRGFNIFNMDATIQESSFSNPVNNVSRKGRILTPDFLRTVNIVYEIEKHCRIENSRMHIIELGAGCGHLARTLRYFITDCSYIIIDIPETLSFSYMFLKLNFPDLKTIYITDEEHLKSVKIDDFDFVFVPTKFVGGISGSKFDIFINTASLGEMNNDVIRYWMDFIQKKLEVKYLFTLNRYLNTIKTDGSLNWRLQENECSVHYDAHWKILNWELEPSFTRCPYVDTLIARYVEIAAQRISPVSETGNKDRSLKLLSEVKDEDWVRLEKDFPPEMTCRDNILVNDLTMNGTLFKLWESVRLDANEFNLAVMLKYLETLLHRQDREFEETYYYENLFDKLFVSKQDKGLLEVQKSIALKRSHRNTSVQPIPSLFMPSQHSSAPVLIEEGFEGYNIVRIKGFFWALLQSVGPIDLAGPGINDFLETNKAQGKCFSGNSVWEIKYLIARSKNMVLQADIAKLIAHTKASNKSS